MQVESLNVKYSHCAVKRLIISMQRVNQSISKARPGREINHSRRLSNLHLTISRGEELKEE